MDETPVIWSAFPGRWGFHQLGVCALVPVCMSGSSSWLTLNLLPISSCIRHSQHSLGLFSSRFCIISQRDLWERKFMNSPTSGKALPEFTLHYPSVWKPAHSISPTLMELLVSFMRDWIFLIWSHTVSVLLPINSTADSIPVLYQLGHLPDRYSIKCCKYHH